MLTLSDSIPSIRFYAFPQLLSHLKRFFLPYRSLGKLPWRIVTSYTLVSTHLPLSGTLSKMVYRPSKPDCGSPSREFGVSFEIAPPAAVRPKTPFTVPVIVAVRPLSAQASSQTNLVMHASLRNENNTAATGLTGTVTSSVRSRHGNTSSGYASFSSLRIGQPGRYRLRVMLGAASHSGVTTKEYIDSGVIHVHSAADAVQRPCKCFS